MEAPVPTFEKSLTELQGVVKKLESGELPLEEALKSFENGVKHARLCQEMLSEAEKKVEILMKQNPGSAAETKPFTPAS